MYKIIFDIDGVLIDTRTSHRFAIQRTVEFFCGKEIQLLEIDKIKAEPGFNNDWYATYVIINAKLLKQDPLVFHLSRKVNQMISYSVVKEIFQLFYHGTKHYSVDKTALVAEKAEEWYENIMSMNQDAFPEIGFFENETPIFTTEELATLSQKFGKLSIFTGRTYSEAEDVLKRFNLRESFDKVISVEDVENLDYINYPELREFGADKSNPVYLYNVPDINKSKKIVYIGDSLNDMLLVDRCRNIFPIESIFFLEVIPDDLRRVYLDEVEKYNPDWIVYSKQEAVELLNKL